MTHFAVWSRAVFAWTALDGDERRSALRACKAELKNARRFGGGKPEATRFSGSKHLWLGYISGLVSAEGSFTFSGDRPRFSMHLRQDDKPLLEMLAARTGIGRLYDHTPRAPLVVEAVRRFEAEHARLPRAMEFFRWRFAGAPDSPTQATVYNLFPGGWAAVLEACRAGYGLG